MKRAAVQPSADLTLFAGIHLKTWTVPDAGCMLPQHAHRWPHISMIVSGAVRVWCGDELVGDFHAPATVKIAALAKHTFQTLVPGVVIACIHATDAVDVEVAADHQLELEE